MRSSFLRLLAALVAVEVVALSAHPVAVEGRAACDKPRITVAIWNDPL
jgi:hypothetical protein